MARKPRGKLRTGYTTGACATAAAAAAFEALTGGTFPDPVTISLPGGTRPGFPLDTSRLEADSATAGVTKDAGDDPDVTHGARILATVKRGVKDSGVVFRAGEGVGTITRPGLALAPGEPAINPAPREMITAHLREIAERHKVPLDVEVTISVPNGETLAKKTLNARLGIIGGLSILGTTGIVIPYSCSAWIHSIHNGIDVARACGLNHIAAATGRTSERAVQKLYNLEDGALIEMGDFAGGLLKYLRGNPVPSLTLAGGFAKISKLAAGHLDLHSSRARVDMNDLAAMLEAVDAPPSVAAAAAQAASAGEVLELASRNGLPLADKVAERARQVAQEALDGKDGATVVETVAETAVGTAVEVVIFDRSGHLIGRAAAP